MASVGLEMLRAQFTPGAPAGTNGTFSGELSGQAQVTGWLDPWKSVEGRGLVLQSGSLVFEAFLESSQPAADLQAGGLQPACLQLAAVGLQGPANLAVQPLRSLLGAVEFKHQKLSSTVCRWWPRMFPG